MALLLLSSHKWEEDLLYILFFCAKTIFFLDAEAQFAPGYMKGKKVVFPPLPLGTLRKREPGGKAPSSVPPPPKGTYTYRGGRPKNGARRQPRKEEEEEATRPELEGKKGGGTGNGKG